MSFDPANNVVKASNAIFYQITSQTGIPAEFDGILGMARPWFVGSFVNGPLMMHYLKNQSVINQNIFGFYIANSSEQSSMTIGGYNAAKIKPGNSITYIPLVKSFYWLISFQGFTVNNKLTFSDNTTSAYLMPTMSRAIIDTGTSLIYVPSGMFVKFV